MRLENFQLANVVNEVTECAICKSPIDEAFGSVP